MASTTTLDGASAFGGADRLGLRHQLLLSAYWFSLSFQGGALLGVAVPAQILGLTSNSNKIWVLGLLGGFSSLVLMVTQPIAGVLSDLSTLRWGRRRTYLVVGAAINISGLMLMIAAHDLTLLFAGFMVTSFGEAISSASYQAYLPDHVPKEQYGEASGYVGAMVMLGTLVSFGMAGWLVAPRAASPFYVVTALVVAAGAVLTAIAIPEPPVPDRPVGVGVSWRELWAQPFRSPNFVIVFITRALMMLALYALFTFVEYYVRDVIHVKHFVQGAALVAGVATLAALVGGVASGWLSDRIGRKLIVTGASVLMASALAVLAFVHALNVLLGVGIVFGISLGAFSAVDWALAMDVLPDRAFAAKDLGIWGISTSLPQTIAPFVGGAVLVGLSPFGPDVGFGALYLGAAACAALSGVLVWRLRGIR
jgi:MFS family permease